MRKFILPLVLSLSAAFAEAQDGITTFILVRHAEKADDGTNDPPLTKAGEDRAAALVQLLRETPVNAIYSTPYKRTRGTVQPLAEFKGLSLLAYTPNKAEQMDELLGKYRGGTVVICGHSNTTPWIANYFLGNERFSTFEDSDYDNVLVLTVVEKGQVTVTRLNYGAPSK